MEGHGISDRGIQPSNVFHYVELEPVEIDYKGETLLVRAIKGHGAPWKQLSGNLLVLNGSFNGLLLQDVDIDHGPHPDFHARVESNTSSDSDHAPLPADR